MANGKSTNSFLEPSWKQKLLAMLGYRGRELTENERGRILAPDETGIGFMQKVINRGYGQTIQDIDFAFGTEKGIPKNSCQTQIAQSPNTAMRGTLHHDLLQSYYSILTNKEKEEYYGSNKKQLETIVKYSEPIVFEEKTNYNILSPLDDIKYASNY